MVLPRVLTAVGLAPLFLWVLYLGNLPFFAFMILLSAVAFWEFQKMSEAGGYATQGVTGLALGGAVAVSLVLPGVRPGLPFHAQAPAFVVMTAVLVSVIRELARKDKSVSLLRIAVTLTGIVVIVWPLGYLGLVRDLRGTGELMIGGLMAATLLVALIWAQDTGAWAVGLWIGKHRLAPAVSPKKSWEGAVGGFGAGLLAALALREIWMQELFGRGEVLALASVLCVLAQVSDLMESLMKRCLGVKDSSGLLPGHGGILDRFDSFLLSTPFLYFYLISVGKVG